jgi:hypothetical protein
MYRYRQSVFHEDILNKIEVLTFVMTPFVLLFMIISTYAYIFSIPSYGCIRIRIRIFFSDSGSDPLKSFRFFRIRIRIRNTVSKYLDPDRTPLKMLWVPEKGFFTSTYSVPVPYLTILSLSAYYGQKLEKIFVITINTAAFCTIFLVKESLIALDRNRILLLAEVGSESDPVKTDRIPPTLF